jgi:hypothetical protein
MRNRLITYSDVTRQRDGMADWFVGGTGKRPLLALIAQADPAERYEQRELATAAGLDPNGSVGRHLRVLAQAGIVVQLRPRGPYRVDVSNPLLEPLAEWLGVLEQMSQVDPRWRLPLPPSRGG